MATSFRFVVAPIGASKQDNKTPIVRLLDISKGVEKAIFTAVFVTSLLLGAVNTTETVLGWYLAALWLFLATALIYTPTLVHVDLIAWSSLGAHLLLQLSHAASYGEQPWIAALVAFVNAFAVIINSVFLAFVGLCLAITQSAVPPSSELQHISLVFATLPIFHVFYRRFKK
jgi:hypothetical protein